MTERCRPTLLRLAGGRQWGRLIQYLSRIAPKHRRKTGSPVSSVVALCAMVTPAASFSRMPSSQPRAAPELGPAILERPKAKKIRQTAALQCFLLVAFCGDFDEKLRGCSCNGLCQGRGGASR